MAPLHSNLNHYFFIFKAHYSDETNGESSSKNFSFLDDDAETDLTTEIDIQV